MSTRDSGAPVLQWAWGAGGTACAWERERGSFPAILSRELRVSFASCLSPWEGRPAGRPSVRHIIVVVVVVEVVAGTRGVSCRSTLSSRRERWACVDTPPTTTPNRAQTRGRARTLVTLLSCGTKHTDTDTDADSFSLFSALPGDKNAHFFPPPPRFFSIGSKHSLPACCKIETDVTARQGKASIVTRCPTKDAGPVPLPITAAWPDEASEQKGNQGIVMGMGNNPRPAVAAAAAGLAKQLSAGAGCIWNLDPVHRGLGMVQ
ncbi:hypothetical protein BS50DRAFT_91405 [Corynespora cassiicola Philippines]|uniref:Uncharacterized protein n=1 Tax=Corynespora cassiicola Philippines TaxID=1448308 RepID=A0A2T2NF32_CORCC|nr:hypothetical protein BS50DRAFT_91405 [Corynespora cassiicola Philippines]